jgi:hypothetical protein
MIFGFLLHFYDQIFSKSFEEEHGTPPLPLSAPLFIYVLVDPTKRGNKIIGKENRKPSIH